MPPFVGVAVNVVEAPAQIVALLATIDTDGVTADVTVIVIPFDVAVAGSAQFAFEVNTQVTICPVVNALEV